MCVMVFILSHIHAEPLAHLRTQLRKPSKHGTPDQEAMMVSKKAIGTILQLFGAFWLMILGFIAFPDYNEIIILCAVLVFIFIPIAWGERLIVEHENSQHGLEDKG